MKQNQSSSSILATMAFTLIFIVVPSGVFARVLNVNRGDSIQDAVDAASSGDTIQINPGVYTGTPGSAAVVTVEQSGITIRGSKGAVIDAECCNYGILVGVDAVIAAPDCPTTTIRNFNLQGLTIKNAEETAVRLVGVDGFTLSKTVYLDNGEYGPFPVCSKNGLIADNFASGHNDAAIYVGNDDNVDVRDNTVTQSTIGVEIENSTNCTVHDNKLFNNTGGILVVVLPGLPMTSTENVEIYHNYVIGNNFVSGEPTLLPPGTGVLNLGADMVEIHDNIISGNHTVGLALFGNPLLFADQRPINPFIDNNTIQNNTIILNGQNPDNGPPQIPAADIVFIPDVVIMNPDGSLTVLSSDPDPFDNCFTDNIFKSEFTFFDEMVSDLSVFDCQ
ncbi:MAG: parallel beta-helix domain-containing protein [Gammaproteobacteria bacterium]